MNWTSVWHASLNLWHTVTEEQLRREQQCRQKAAVIPERVKFIRYSTAYLCSLFNCAELSFGDITKELSFSHRLLPELLQSASYVLMEVIRMLREEM